MSAPIEMRPLAAVGVIVINEEGRVLLGERLASHGAGTFQIPGGHMEFGRSFEEQARMEVTEETGLTELIFERLICVNNERVYGKHYVSLGFLMHGNGEPGNPEPEKSRNWKWYDPNELPAPLFAPSKGVLDAWRSGIFLNEIAT